MTIQIEGMTPGQLLDLASEFTLQPPSFLDTDDSVRIVKAFQADGSIRWAVYQGYWHPATVLNTAGQWETEPSGSNRDDDFYARCRFGDFTEAFRAADRAAAQQRIQTDLWFKMRQKVG